MVAETRLAHINIPAVKPDWLAEWYAEHFGFPTQDGFVITPGIILVFMEGQPSNYGNRIHFGFRCSDREQVATWAHKLEVELEESERFCGFKAADPEGNHFEVFWEQGA